MSDESLVDSLPETIGPSDDGQAQSEPEQPESQAESVLDESAQTSAQTGDDFDAVKQEAAAYGLSEEDIAKFKDADSLRDALRQFDRSLMEYGRQAAQSAAQQVATPVQQPQLDSAAGMPQSSPPIPTPQPPASDIAQQPVLDLPDEMLEISLDEDEYGDGLTKTISNVTGAVKTIRDTINREIGTLRQYVSTVAQVVQQQQMAHVLNEFDAAIQRVGQPELFGEGNTAKIQPGTPHAVNRMKVLDAANSLAIGYQMSGRSLPDMDTLIKRAIAVAFDSNGTQGQSSAPKKRGATMRPSRRAGAEPRGMDAAIEFAERKSKEIFGS